MEESSQKGNKNYALIGGVIIVATIALFALASRGGYEPTLSSIVVGNENAPVVIEEYSSFQCPACKQAAPFIAGAMKEYPESVQFIYKNFPLSNQSMSRPAAHAGYCAAEQDKFKDYHDLLFDNQSVWSSNTGTDYFAEYASQLGLDLEAFNTCRESRAIRQLVQSEYDEGLERGVNSTPTFFINGEKVAVNPTSVFGWIQLIKAELGEEAPESDSTEESLE